MITLQVLNLMLCKDLYYCFSFLISASVVGQSECESVSIVGIHVNPFNPNELRLHSLNESEQEIFTILDGEFIMKTCFNCRGAN